MIYHFNNTPIYYTRKGIGPAIVMLHGFIESSTMWENISPYFIETHTVLCIDLPGFGNSGIVNEIHSMELMAQITAEILKVENMQKVTLLGHSMGGYVALALAEIAPQLIKKLILLNSSPLEDSIERIANRNRALSIIDKNKDAFLSMAISNLFTLTERKKFASEIVKLKAEAFQLTSNGVKAAIIGMRDRKDRTIVLKNFIGIKLIICGSDDAIAPVNQLFKISEDTKSIFHIISGGHMTWMTNNNEIIQKLCLIE